MFGIVNWGSQSTPISPTIHNVRITVVGDPNVGTIAGIYNSMNGSAPSTVHVSNTIIDVSGYSPYGINHSSHNGVLTVENSTMNGYRAIAVNGEGSAALIRNSSIIGDYVWNNSILNIALTELDISSFTGTGTYKCYGVYDANYQDVTCP